MVKKDEGHSNSIGNVQDAIREGEETPKDSWWPLEGDAFESC